VALAQPVVQQSDYVEAWRSPNPPNDAPRHPGLLSLVREFALRHNLLARMVRVADSTLTSRVPDKLRNHPNLTRVRAG
jgi:hypothetical protein